MFQCDVIVFRNNPKFCVNGRGRKIGFLLEPTIPETCITFKRCASATKCVIENEIFEVDVLVEGGVLEGGSLAEGEVLSSGWVCVAQEVYFLELGASEADLVSES